MHDVWETRVRYAETDAQGIVFYGNYLTYQDETFSQFLREVDYSWEEMADAGWEAHVVHTELDYRSQAEFGDELVCGIRASAISESSLTFDWRCRRRDGPVVAEGNIVHAAVDEAGETIRVPQPFRDAVVAYQETPPDPV
jgi:acyl-CoA thioester hydrolase